MKILLLTYIFMILPLFADNLQTPIFSDNKKNPAAIGYVDWEKNIVVAYGQASAPDGITNPVQKRLLGFRGAKIVAYRNLLELVGNIQVTSTSRLSEYMISDDLVTTKIEGVLKGATVLPNSQGELKDGAYTIAVSLPLLGKLSKEIFPAITSPVSSPIDILPKSIKNDSTKITTPAEISVPVYVPPKPHTGLLVDARGLDLQPCMAPVVRSKDGRIVYSASTIETNYATQYGIVSYENNLESAIKSERLGGVDSNPLIVKAHSVAGAFSGDLILGDFDATKVLMADIDGDFLKSCRVVFLIGPSPIVIDANFVDSLYQLQSLPDSLIFEDAPIEFSEEIPDSNRTQ